MHWNVYQATSPAWLRIPMEYGTHHYPPAGSGKNWGTSSIFYGKNNWVIFLRLLQNYNVHFFDPAILFAANPKNSIQIIVSPRWKKGFFKKVLKKSILSLHNTYWKLSLKSTVRAEFRTILICSKNLLKFLSLKRSISWPRPAKFSPDA